MLFQQLRSCGWKFSTSALCVAWLVFGSAGASAQPPGEARPLTDEELQVRRTEMDQKLESLLKELDMFYKSSTDQNGNAIFTVLFEGDGGQSSQLKVNVKKTGTYRHEPLWVVYTYTIIASVPEGRQLPAAAVQAMTDAADGLVVGGYSTSKDHSTVYANTSAFLNNMTAGELWMCLAQAHGNRVDLKPIIDPLLQ